LITGSNLGRKLLVVSCYSNKRTFGTGVKRRWANASVIALLAPKKSI
jgi:hypothetical protein